MRIKMGSCILVSMVMIFCAATASDAAWGRMGKRGDPGEKIAKRLNLNEQQKKVLLEDSQERRTEGKAAMEKIKGLEGSLRTELAKDAPDRNAVHKYIKEINEQRIAVELKRIDSLLDLQKILDPKQKEEFKKMLQEKRPPFLGGGPKPR